ncbi:hypothetical protein B0H13DRAFT_2666082 [Mycena leptocephala]|nr:hypothetical protein B0H13DRAFT_2666082 [Mycena leptocephala]
MSHHTIADSRLFLRRRRRRHARARHYAIRLNTPWSRLLSLHSNTVPGLHNGAHQPMHIQICDPRSDASRATYTPKLSFYAPATGALPRSLYSQCIPRSLIHVSNTIRRCVPTRSLSHKTLGSSFFPCSRVLLSFDLEPCPPAGPGMLALPASELPAPTPSCPADHPRDGHARKLGGFESASRAPEVQRACLASHRTFPPYIRGRSRAWSRSDITDISWSAYKA